MKRFILLLTAITFTLSGCNSVSTDSDKKTLTVTILPQKNITKQIAGDVYEVNVMIPPGASPATYEPTPRQLGKLNHSKAYLKTGHLVFEKAWMDKFKSSTPGLKIFDTSKGLNLIEKNGRIDPHIWTSPEMVAGMAQNIRDILLQLTREESKTERERINTNYQKFEKEIDSLQQTIKSMLKPFRGEAFLIYHPALSYYCREFNLKQISIEVEGKEPSASYMQKVIRESKEKNIKAILIQEQFDKKKALTIANELNAKVITINPLAEDWSNSIMDITKKLAEAFKSKNHESG